MGIYKMDEEPIYTLVFLTSNHDVDTADLFMGGINLQLVVQNEYAYYLATNDE